MIVTLKIPISIYKICSIKVRGKIITNDSYTQNFNTTIRFVIAKLERKLSRMIVTVKISQSQNCYLPVAIAYNFFLYASILIFRSGQ